MRDRSLIKLANDLKEKCINYALHAGFTNNLYFSSYPRRKIVLRNLSHVCEGALYVKSRERVLDFGTGAGILLPALSSVYKSVIAVDIDREQLSAARKLCASNNITNVDFQLKSTENELGDFDEGMFDCIVADNVLEHILNATDFPNEFFRILKNKGLAVISLPTENFIYRFFKSKDSGHVLDQEQIINLIELFRQKFQGMEILDVGPFFITRVFSKYSLLRGEYENK